MKQVKKLYRSHEQLFTGVLFPLLLLVYPFLTVNQGVDVSDSTYSLSNFLFFGRLDGTWVISTYLSNVVGWLLTCLPFGHTLLGMRVYTTLLISGIALLVYACGKKWMPAWIVFVGEVIALGFCWIPSGILYNYLTYFFFTLGTLLLYRGLVEEENGTLAAAGVVLGLNVLVRIPNLTQMALIVGVWYYQWSKNHSFSDVCVKTAYCLAGYLAGVILPLIAVLVQYGTEGIAGMLQGLGSIQSTDDSYSLLSMIRSVLDAYRASFRWVFLLGILIALGMAGFACLKGRFQLPAKLLTGLALLVLLRFFWGRGMFSFRYYEDYSSIYEWGMVGLYLTWFAALFMLFSAQTSREEKLMALLVLVILAVTPLGSNNYTFQNLNNLFLAAPFCLYTFVKLYRRRSSQPMFTHLAFPWKAGVGMVAAMILVQSIGFHLNFAFRDGMDGTPRDYRFTGESSLQGMKTTAENGEALQGLMDWAQEEITEKQELLLYGNCPGLSFLLDMPVAIGTAWPDLDSYSYTAFDDDLTQITNLPVVIIRGEEWAGELSQSKGERLLGFLEENHYNVAYQNEMYTVYLN